MALIVWRVMPNALGEILLRHLVALEAQSANRGLQRNEPIPLVEGRPDIVRRANRDDHQRHDLDDDKRRDRPSAGLLRLTQCTVILTWCK